MNKHYLITGATDGIGKATALAIAKSGATVVLVGRNPEKSQAVLDEIYSATYNKNLHLLIADLSSQAQIHQLADDYHKKFNRLDVLINNAGGYFYQRQVSVDGIELTFALNHLAYFMLTGLLIDLLIDTSHQTQDARVVNVSSEAHRYKRDGIPLGDLQTSRRYNAMKAYSSSKLANIMFTYQLAIRLESTSVTANVVHPGFVRTGFTRHAHGLSQRIFAIIAQAFAKSPEEGAKNSIHVATSDEIRGVTGKYFIKEQATNSNDPSYDTEAQQKLWDISLDMTQLDDFPSPIT